MPRTKRTVPWLDQRGDVFYVNWYDEKERRTFKESLRTTDAGAARIRFAEWLAAGPGRTRRAAGVNVEDILDAYYREHVEKQVAAADRQRYAIEHLKAYFHDTPIGLVDIPKSRGYAEARRQGVIGGGSRCKDKRGGDATIRRELNVLVAASNHALRWKRIGADQLPQVELPVPGQSEDVKWLTKSELRHVFDSAAGPLKAFCRIAYYTAARRRSIEFLTKFQVDLPNGRISLSKPGDRITKKRRPVVPIYPEIRPDVEGLLASSTTEWLFGRPVDFYREFKELCADIGIEAHPHMLRHSRATHMLMDGEDIYKVAKLLGDTIATVERVYGHFSPEFLATESNAL